MMYENIKRGKPVDGTRKMTKPTPKLGMKRVAKSKRLAKRPMKRMKKPALA